MVRRHLSAENSMAVVYALIIIVLALLIFLCVPNSLLAGHTRGGTTGRGIHRPDSRH